MATSCGFESHRPHQNCRTTSICQCWLLRDQQTPHGHRETDAIDPKTDIYRVANGCYFPRQRNAGSSAMSNAPSDTPRSFWRKPVRTSLEADAVANAAGVPLGLHDEEPAFEVPARL